MTLGFRLSPGPSSCTLGGSAQSVLRLSGGTSGTSMSTLGHGSRTEVKGVGWTGLARGWVRAVLCSSPGEGVGVRPHYPPLKRGVPLLPKVFLRIQQDTVCKVLGRVPGTSRVLSHHAGGPLPAPRWGLPLESPLQRGREGLPECAAGWKTQTSPPFLKFSPREFWSPHPASNFKETSSIKWQHALGLRVTQCNPFPGLCSHLDLIIWEVASRFRVSGPEQFCVWGSQGSTRKALHE